MNFLPVHPGVANRGEVGITATKTDWRCAAEQQIPRRRRAGVVGPDVRPFPITAPIMADLEGNPVEEPRTPQMKFTIQLSKPVPPMSMLRRSVDLSAK